MSDPIEYVRERLAQQDQRLTPQRETVLRVLLDHADTHLTAEEVYLEARNRAPELGLATVYRTLDLFARLGVVRRLDAGEGVARYEFHPEGAGHYHHHLICLECGQILEFEQDLLDRVERAVERETGFRVVDHSLLSSASVPTARNRRTATGTVPDRTGKPPARRDPPAFSPFSSRGLTTPKTHGRFIRRENQPIYSGFTGERLTVAWALSTIAIDNQYL